MALLTAQEAIELSATFPYTRGRRQLPLSERVFVNDLYGTPLYQPAMGHLELGRQTGVRAAAEVTGADPKFVFDHAVMSPEGPRAYERPRIDPGPM